MLKASLLILVVSIFLFSACGTPAVTEQPTQTTPQTYTLSVIVSPSGAGSVSPPGGKYESGLQVTLTATPLDGYIFDYWDGATSGSSNIITILMNSDKSATAHFKAIATPTAPTSTPTPTTPPTPLSLVPVLGAVNVPIDTLFTWSAVAGAVSYEFEIAEETGQTDKFYLKDAVAGPTVNAYKLPNNLKYDKQYWWRVRVVIAAGAKSDWTVSFFTTKKAPVLSLVPILGAVDVPVDITFTWPAVAGAVSYEFEIAEETGQTDKFYLKDEVGSTTVNAYKLVDNLKYDTQYWWRVRAANVAGVKSAWTTSFFTTEKTPTTTTSQVPALGAVNVPIDITFTWPAVAGAVRYEFELAEEIGQTDKFYLKDKVGSTTVNAYKLVDNLKYDTQYWWRVRAANVAGVKSAWTTSFFTTEKASTTTTSQVPALGAVNVAVDITFTWSAVTGAISYEFEIAEEIGQIDKFYLKDAVGSTTVNSYKLLSSLKYNKQYWWRVRPITSAGVKGDWLTSFFTTKKEVY